jgi:ectoine hydroxylase-related dioxygenase (phytanoyl-CoA dioxygenase family)
MRPEYENNGYFMVKKAISEDEVKSLINSLNVFEKEINHYGIRDLMNKLPCIRELALSAPLLSIAKEILGEKAKPVRAVFFDKLPNANWNVAWHQDTSIVVNAKADIAGFSAWREKQGVMHVEPPEEYLSNIVTLRVHLDPANTKTGVLRVIPETHKNGRVSSKNILEVVEQSEAMECTANVGDVLLMNPLLFHSSRKATKPKHRRVIHLEYSAMTLPEPLEWYEEHPFGQRD